MTIKEKITPITVLRTVPLAQSLGFFQQFISNGRSHSQGSGIAYSQKKDLTGAVKARQPLRRTCGDLPPRATRDRAQQSPSNSALTSQLKQARNYFF